MSKESERIEADAVEIAGLYHALDGANARIAALEFERGRLREALRAVVRIADRKTVEFDAAKKVLGE